MADNQESTEKTEEPTQKRLQESIKKGQVSFSREITNFLMFLVLALNIVWFAPVYMKGTLGTLAPFIQKPHDIRIDEGSSIILLKDTASSIALYLLLPILGTIIAAFLSSFIQNGVVISGESLIPKLEKISVFKGIKRLFSLKSFMEFIKGLIKITIIGTTAYLIISPEMDGFANMVTYSIKDILNFLYSISFKVVVAATAIMGVIAVLDFMYQKFEYIKSLRMTKQEIKEEYKQSEGDPHIKGRLRQIRMEKAQKRMMSAVPDSDVVIRNPTHYAIALKYDRDVMDAPLVVALGMDNVALKIIEIAEDNDVAVVTNKPLARVLYESSEIDSEIPVEHYQAVAEIIGYIYKLKNKK